MVKGKMTGWKFRRNQHRSYNADGASSLETLTSEKRRLENRLVEIPKQIAQLNQSVELTQNDINWLNSLSNRNRRKWEEEHGETVENATYQRTNRVNAMKAQVTALGTEKARIPEQLSNVQKQLDALVQGEATGLERGLDKETARELGEIELQNEQEEIDHQRALRQAELEQQQEVPEPKSLSMGAKVAIGAGVLLLLALIGYAIYKKRAATKLVPV